MSEKRYRMQKGAPWATLSDWPDTEYVTAEDYENLQAELSQWRGIAEAATEAAVRSPLVLQEAFEKVRQAHENRTANLVAKCPNCSVVRCAGNEEAVMSAVRLEMCLRCEGIGRYGGAECAACFGTGARMQNVVLISGKQGAGKSGTASALAAQWALKTGAPVTRLKFAQPLYEIANLVCAELRFRGVDVKENHPSFKPLLQRLGAWGRELVSPEIWVDLARQQAEFAPEGSLIVFDDCRFENELRAFPGAFTVRLECREDVRRQRADRWREDTGHPSEVGLDHWLTWNLQVTTELGNAQTTAAIIVDRLLAKREG